MASQLADLQTNNVATPPVRNKVNKLQGRIRTFEATITLAAGLAVGETITWGDLPRGARVLGHLGQLNWAAGAATCTLNLGDAASAARHLAATAVTTAGVAVPQAQSANGATFETTDSTETVTNNCRLISTVAGATMQTGQVITLRLPYVLD